MEADTRHLFKAALAKVKAEEGFVTSVAPGSLARRPNRYYASDEEFLHALGEAMREEHRAYQAIVEAGFVSRLDDPGLPNIRDMAQSRASVEECKKFATVWVRPSELTSDHAAVGAQHLAIDPGAVGAGEEGDNRRDVRRRAETL